MQLVILDALRSDGREGTCAHVQRQKGLLDAPVNQRRQRRSIEMESRRRRRHRAWRLCEHRLIPLAVRFVRIALDVRQIGRAHV